MLAAVALGGANPPCGPDPAPEAEGCEQALDEPGAEIVRVDPGSNDYAIAWANPWGDRPLYDSEADIVSEPVERHDVPLAHVPPFWCQPFPSEGPKSGLWRFGVTELTVEDAQEQSGDEPVLVILGFSTQLQVPGTTRVFWDGQVVKVGEDLHAPATVALPLHQNGADVHVRAMWSDLDERQPEVIGAVVAAIENDSCSLGRLATIIGDALPGLEELLEDIAQRSTVDLLADLGSLRSRVKEEIDLSIGNAGSCLGGPDDPIATRVFLFTENEVLQSLADGAGFDELRLLRSGPDGSFTAEGGCNSDGTDCETRWKIAWDIELDPANFVPEPPALMDHQVLAGDFSGDGYLDFTFAGHEWSSVGRPQLRTRLNDGRLRFTRHHATSSWDAAVLENPVRVGDIDGDCRDDLVFTGAGWSAGLEIRTLRSAFSVSGAERGDGAASYHHLQWLEATEVTAEPASTAGGHVVVGDVDSDLDSDLVFLTYSNLTGPRTVAMLSNGDGTWTRGNIQYWNVAEPDWATQPLVADFDGDLREDVLFFSAWREHVSDYTVLLSQGNGSFHGHSGRMVSMYQHPEGPPLLDGWDLVAGDWDGDGDRDFAHVYRIRDTSGFPEEILFYAKVYLNDGKGGFQPALDTQGPLPAWSEFTQFPPLQVVAGNLDADATVGAADAADEILLGAIVGSGDGAHTLLLASLHYQPGSGWEARESAVFPARRDATRLYWQPDSVQPDLLVVLRSGAPYWPASMVDHYMTPNGGWNWYPRSHSR
jgi:hypothetical protein